MTENEREQLKRRMEAAVLLAQNEPYRLQVLDEIVSAGRWAEDYWLDLVSGDERLRLDLRRVEVPAGLAERLRMLPDEGSVEPTELTVAPFGKRRFWGRRTVLATAAMIVAAAIAWLAVLSQGTRLDGSWENFVRLAIAHHLEHEKYPMPPDGTPLAVAQSKLNQELPFQVLLPRMEGFEFIGYSACPLGRSQVACTRWMKAGKTYTLFELNPADYGLPKTVEHLAVLREQDLFGRGSSTVRFWSEAGHHYAMIGDGELPSASVAAL